MISRITTFAFEGVEARPIDVQVQLSGGANAFNIVGLPDKAVGESRERVRAAFTSLGLSLPPERTTVNLAPADLPKEGSHYDLAIALAILAAIGAIPRDSLEGVAAIGELALDGGLANTAGNGCRSDGDGARLSGRLWSGGGMVGRHGAGCSVTDFPGQSFPGVATDHAREVRASGRTGRRA